MNSLNIYHKIAVLAVLFFAIFASFSVVTYAENNVMILETQLQQIVAIHQQASTMLLQLKNVEGYEGIRLSLKDLIMISAQMREELEEKSKSGVQEEFPLPPTWSPQKQALLPDKTFDTNWVNDSHFWHANLNRNMNVLALDGKIVSPRNENYVKTTLGLSPGLPPKDGSKTLRYIYKKEEGNDLSLNLIVELYDKDVLLEKWVERDIDPNWVIQERAIVNEPSSWEDLRVTLINDVEHAEENIFPVVYVSLVEVEIPYPEEFSYPYLNPATTTSSDDGRVRRPSGVQDGDVIFVCTINGEAEEGFQLIRSTRHNNGYHLKTWWKRAGNNEPDVYSFTGAQGIWASRISGAADLPSAVKDKATEGNIMPTGIMTPSVDVPLNNSLIVRISANSLYLAWTEPSQWVSSDYNKVPVASWKFQKKAGPSGEELHQTGSFIHWVAQTIAISPVLGDAEDCVCISLYDPVCGVDGTTYSNECEAECLNVKIDYKGECRDKSDNNFSR